MGAGPTPRLGVASLLEILTSGLLRRPYTAASARPNGTLLAAPRPALRRPKTPSPCLGQFLQQVGAEVVADRQSSFAWPRLLRRRGVSATLGVAVPQLGCVAGTGPF